MRLATEEGGGGVAGGLLEAFGGGTPTLTRGVGIVDDDASNSAARYMRADAKPFAAPKTPGGGKAKVWVRDAAAAATTTTTTDAPEAMIA